MVYFAHMTANKTTLNELGEMLAHVVKHMATKDDLKFLATKDDLISLAGQVASIERDLKVIRRDLNEVTEEVQNISGYRREIDHALERIGAIEKHLGVERKIAA
jgi:hypothetical protein